MVSKNAHQFIYYSYSLNVTHTSLVGHRLVSQIMGVESQTSEPIFSHPMALAATIITLHLRVLLVHEFTDGVMDAYPNHTGRQPAQTSWNYYVVRVMLWIRRMGNILNNQQHVRHIKATWNTFHNN